MCNTTVWKYRKYALIGLISYLILYYDILILAPDSTILSSNLLGLLGHTVSVGLIVVGRRYWHNPQRRAWTFFALGVLLYAIGDAIWAFDELALDIEVHSPSLCDLFYLASTISYFIALFCYFGYRRRLELLRSVMDILIALTAGTTVTFKYVLLPIYANPKLGFWEKIISMLYPILDIGYLAGIISLILLNETRHRLNQVNRRIILAFFLIFAADQLFLIYSSQMYVSDGWLDPLWPAASWLLALAALHPDYTRTVNKTAPDNEQQTAHHHSLLHTLSLASPYLLAGMLILIVSWQYIFIDPLVTGAALTTMLLLIRQVITLVQSTQLLQTLKTAHHTIQEDKHKLEYQYQRLQIFNDLKNQEANTDFLTNLFNRRYIDQTMDLLTHMDHDTDGLQISLLLIDIDFFKQINDKWGHHIGDMVLQHVAQAIKNTARPTDIPGRFGGDEFILILPDTSREQLEHTAQNLLKRISFNPFLNELHVTLSIGGYAWNSSQSTNNATQLIEAADTALYTAKENGRNQYQILS